MGRPFTVRIDISDASCQKGERHDSAVEWPARDAHASGQARNNASGHLLYLLLV
jgi:hypothetical protein